jgi:hypothetical protein
MTVFIHRDLRDVLISSLRWSMNIGDKKEKPLTPQYVAQVLYSQTDDIPKIDPLMGWLNDADLVLGFKDLWVGSKVRELLALAGAKRQPVHTLIGRTVNTDTKTWTRDRRRSDYREHWSPLVEELWQQCKLHPYNVRLGYES